MDKLLINKISSQETKCISLDLIYDVKFHYYNKDYKRFKYPLLTFLDTKENEILLKTVAEELENYYSDNVHKIETLNIISYLGDLNFFLFNKTSKKIINSDEFKNIFSSKKIYKKIKLLYDTFSNDRAKLRLNNTDDKICYLKCIIISHFLDCVKNVVEEFLCYIVNEYEKFMEDNYYSISKNEKNSKNKKYCFDNFILNYQNNIKYDYIIENILPPIISRKLEKLFKYKEYCNSYIFDECCVEEEYTISDEILSSSIIKNYADKLFEEIDDVCIDLFKMIIEFYQNHPLGSHVLETFINFKSKTFTNKLCYIKPMIDIRKINQTFPIKEIGCISQE